MILKDEAMKNGECINTNKHVVQAWELSAFLLEDFDESRNCI